MNTANLERNELCDLFLEVGPDVPTLCEGWLARDLAVHLVIRDRRPDAAAGMFVPFLAARKERVQADIARQPWEHVVETIRSGPPVWSPVRLDPINKGTNTIEFFVHHEDVRRPAPGWEPRPADRQRYAALKAQIPFMAKLAFRKAKTSVAFDYEDGTVRAMRTVSGAPVVTIKGTPDEIVMYTLGRRTHARVELDGDQAAVADFIAIFGDH